MDEHEGLVGVGGTTDPGKWYEIHAAQQVVFLRRSNGGETIISILLFYLTRLFLCKCIR